MITVRWAEGHGKYEQVEFRRLFRPVKRPVPPDAEMVTAYTDGTVTLRSNRRRDGYHEAADVSKMQGVHVGDFVIHGLDILRGSVGISDSAGAISAVCTICEPIGEVDPRYFVWVIRAQASSGFPRALARGIREGGADFRRWGTLAELPVPCPTPAQQGAIAHYLDTETSRIDTLITKKRRMIELLDARWRSFRRHAILRGLNPVRGGGLVEPWDEMNLGVLVELQRGHDLPSTARVEGDVPVVSSGGVSGWHEAAAADGPGVITGRYGTIGAVYYVEEPYWPLNTTLYVKDFRGTHPRWVYHLLAVIPLDIDSQKSAVSGINRNIVGSLRVPRPSVARQRELARYLDEAEAVSDKARKSLQTQIDLFSERRQALITATVTGELAVPVD